MVARSTGHRLYGSHIYEDAGEQPGASEISSPGRRSAKTAKAKAPAEPMRGTAHRLYGSHIYEEELSDTVVRQGPAELKWDELKAPTRDTGSKKRGATSGTKR